MVEKLLGAALLILFALIVAMISAAVAQADKRTPPQALMVGGAAFVAVIMVGTALWAVIKL